MGKNVVLDDDEDEVEPEDLDAEEEVEGRYDEEDEDEDEEGQDEYEKDDFIVDEVEEEEPDEEEERADSDEEREMDDMLYEDDYELLRDNNAFHNRPKDSKKFKRLKKAQRDSGADQFGLSDDEFDGTGEGGRTAEEKLKRTLFGDDEGPLEDIAEEEQVEEELDGDLGDEDEMADFIVEEDEIDEHGAPVRRMKLKRKKFRQAPGVSSSALQEAHEIFGDVDELLQLRKQGLESSELRERKLEDEFEPIVLSEKYMTEKDDQIRMKDFPERMQLSEESTGPPPIEDRSLMEESAWILNQLNSGVVPLFGQRQVESSEKGNDLAINEDDLFRFVQFHHVQKLDIPFIAVYRKEEISSLLRDPEREEVDSRNLDESSGVASLKWHKVLWAIQDLDRKWLLLQKRKAALNSYYDKRFEEESRRVDDITRLTLNQQLFDSILNSLKFAESEREVDDVDMKFNLHFPPGEVGVDEGQYKRPKRRSQYSICSKAGLWEVASKFGCSAEQLGSYLYSVKVGEELEDPKETPEEVASNFTCAMFETPQAVLKGARHMVIVFWSIFPVKMCHFHYG